jgi:hypothetical protein
MSFLGMDARDKPAHDDVSDSNRAKTAIETEVEALPVSSTRYESIDDTIVQ